MTAAERWDGQLGMTGDDWPTAPGRPIRGEPIRCAVKGCDGHTTHLGSACPSCRVALTPPCGFWNHLGCDCYPPNPGPFHIPDGPYAHMNPGWVEAGGRCPCRSYNTPH